jgi:hypothetical protein
VTTQTIEAPTTEVPLREAPDPVEVVKPLKLSEAIRLGSMGTAQASTWYDEGVDADGKPQHQMCAISTAWYALTGHAEQSGESSELHHMLRHSSVVHPVNGQVWSLDSAIIDLNDQCDWTRPQIADWLEGMGL